MSVVRQVAAEGAFTLGAHVDAFEQDLAAHCETRFAVGVSSGTAALALSLQALQIGPGDEVIVPANTFIATAEAVSSVGATPRIVDVDRGSHLITAEIVRRNLGPRVRCVIPVHLFGATVDLDPMLTLAPGGGDCPDRGCLPGSGRALSGPAGRDARRPSVQPPRIGTAVIGYG